MICGDFHSLTLCSVLRTLTNKLVNFVRYVLERNRYSSGISRDELRACADALGQWEQSERQLGALGLLPRRPRGIFYSYTVGMGTFAICQDGEVTLVRHLQPSIAVPRMSIARRIYGQLERPVQPAPFSRALHSDGEPKLIAGPAEPARIGPPANR